MLDRNLRVYKEELLTPVADNALRRVHPTTLTLIGFAFGIGAGLAAWQGLYVLGFGLWALNRIFDGLDGTVARRYNKQTDLGGYIDIMLDDVIYVFVVFMMALGVNSLAGYIAVGALIASYRVNVTSWLYLSTVLEKRQQGAKSNKEMTSVTMPPGLIEGTETVVAYFIFFALPGQMVWLFWAFTVLVTITAAQRMVWAVRNL
ncbi:MAG: CDP-alcohol phosphatidyltransferase family protein [Chloroflexota bacterium]